MSLTFYKKRRSKNPVLICITGLMALLTVSAIIYSLQIGIAANSPATEDYSEDLQSNFMVSDAIPNQYADFVDDGRTVIVIDPGHGGMDTGCESNGTSEKDINLRIANELEHLLEKKDYRVIMTRSDDIDMTKPERVDLANHVNAALYISIHQNYYEEEQANGIETWYTNSEEIDNYNLTRFIHNEVIKSTNTTDRGYKEDSTLYVTRETNMPSCLIETGFLSNNNEYKSLNSKKYQKKIAQGIANGIELYLNPKIMYMTFDDGPSVKNTERILKTLKKKNIKATFFLIGENIYRHPELAKRIMEEGHVIGLHSYTHDYEYIYASVDNFFEDFDKTYDIVRDTLGIESNLFRFPGGSINNFNQDVYKDIIKELDNRGIIYFDWNVSLEDATKDPQPEKLIENALEGAKGRSRVTLLAHETINVTADILEEIIDLFPEYYMKALTEETEPVQFRINK